MKKVIAIHQPNYIPWLGFFYKMAKCDIFVYLDVVQYPRGQSFAARNRIKIPNGTAYLTIPVSKPAGSQGKAKYTEVEFAGTNWKQKHLTTIEKNYKRAPYFEEIFKIYREEILKHEKLVPLNIGLIEAFAGYLGIQSQQIKLSDILTDFRQKTELIIDICDALNADTYLSGTGGGKDYNDEVLLNKYGIDLIYSRFVHPKYPQLWNGFEPHLSILDLLFNCGTRSNDILTGNPQV